MTRRQERRLREIVRRLRVEDARREVQLGLQRLIDICENEQRRERYRECLRLIAE